MRGQQCLGVTGAGGICAGTLPQQVGFSELKALPVARAFQGDWPTLLFLLSCPRATEELEKTTTTYLDNGTHPVQGEASPRPRPCPGPAPHPLLGLLTFCVCLSPPPDWAQLDSDSSLFP